MPVETADAIDVSFRFFGLAPNSSWVAVQEAFRRYAKEFHPDQFPAGSNAQKMANEKIIACNQHFARLKKWFEEHPNGEAQAEEAAKSEPKDEGDWTAWEKERRCAFDEELNEWIKRQESVEREKTATRENIRRRKLVFYCRSGLAAITAFMWMGWFSENDELARKKAQYDEQNYSLNQIARGGSDLSRQTHEMWMRHTQAYNPDPGEKQKEQPGKLVMLLLWSGGAGWLFFSKAARGYVDKYIEGAGL